MKVVILCAAIFFTTTATADQIQSKCIKVENLKEPKDEERKSIWMRRAKYKEITNILNLIPFDASQLRGLC